MHAYGWSRFTFTMPLILGWLLMMVGCQGTIAPRQQIQMTEEASVFSPNAQGPPQRLAASNANADATNPTRVADVSSSSNDRTNSNANRKSSEVKTRLAKSVSTPAIHRMTDRQFVGDLAERPSDLHQADMHQRAESMVRQTSATTDVTPNHQRRVVAKTPTTTNLTTTRTSSATQAKAKAGNKATTGQKITTGKKMKFSDLPQDVRERAMKRLVANLSKDAIRSTQPGSVQRALQVATDDLPELPPLRNSTPPVTPSRIAQSASTLTDSTKAPVKDGVLRDIQVSTLVSSDPQPPLPPQSDATTHREVHSSLPSKAVSLPSEAVALPSEVVALPSEVVALPSEVVALPSEVVATNTKPVTKPFTFDLPSIELPAQEIVIPQPRVAETPKATKATKATKAIEATEAIAKTKSPFQWQLPPINKKPEPTATQSPAPGHNLSLPANRTIAVATKSNLLNKLDSIPHDLHRQRFRVSQVGLREPHDYFVGSDWNDSDMIETAVHSAPNEFDSLGTDAPAASMVQGIPSHSPDVLIDTPPSQQSNTTAAHSAFSLPPVKTASTRLRKKNVPRQTKDEPSITKSEDLKTKDVAETTTDANPELPAVADVQSMSDRELYDALLQRLTDPANAETAAERSRRQILARHLMVLSGNRDAAAKEMKGLSKPEQEFLRHQLEGLYAMVDPQGHPVPGRRFSSALPKLRQATMYLSAAADNLEVRGLEFCTEIEAYGQIKPFPTRQFNSGQPVILYCEVDSFTTVKTDQGYETHLKGSYDVYNEAGTKVASQRLPEDKQVSRNHLRDYFVAYQMNLPTKLPPGKYRLQLTMEDVGGSKYGQSEIGFQIKPR